MMNRIGEVAVSVLRIEERQNEILTQLATCTKSINEHAELLSSHQQSLTELRTEVSVLQDSQTMLASQVESASVGIRSLESRLDLASSTPVSDDIPEIIDRVEKSHNLLLLNLAESSDDLRNVKAIVDHVHPSASKFIAEIDRFPGKQTDKPRWLKVTFTTSEVVGKVLRNKKSLHGSMQFREVVIRGDMTRKQLSELDELRKELRRRQEQGEVHLTIRYQRGKPTIVPDRKFQNPSVSKNRLN